VGRKTANVVLANAFGIPALAVDTHIYRVARRLGLSTGTTPDRVEADLCSLFPPERWIELHHQFIFHGRRVCHARKPECGSCPLADLCPTGLGQIPDPHTGARLESAGPGPGATAPPAAPGPGPERIVSLVPSVTELLVQWGLATRLAGRTSFCVEPGWIRASVPAVGGTKTPDIARIIALRPDLVIMERDENTLAAAEALAAAGLRLLVLKVRSLKDCLAAFRQLGDAVGLGDLGRDPGATLDEALAFYWTRTQDPRPPELRAAHMVLYWLVAARETAHGHAPDAALAEALKEAGHALDAPQDYLTELLKLKANLDAARSTVVRSPIRETRHMPDPKAATPTG